MYYEFEDSAKKKIVAAFAGPQGLSFETDNRIIEELPDDDPRVLEYSGPEWIKEKYLTFSLTSFEDLLFVYEYIACITPGYFYRGESNADWTISSPIEREIDDFTRSAGIHKFESRIIEEARRRAHLYLENVPDYEDVTSWLSLLRHNGAPTRLIDITQSLFIALYFAVSDNLSKDGTLWAFGPQFFMESSRKFQIYASENKSTLFYNDQSYLVDGYMYPQKHSNEKNTPRNVTADDVLKDYPFDQSLVIELALQGLLNARGVLLLHPYWSHKRIDAQKGNFIFPLDMKFSSFENMMQGDIFNPSVPEGFEFKSLKGTAYANRAFFNTSIVKFNIPSSSKPMFKKLAEQMNISKLTLFPDVDGFLGLLKDLVPKKS
ncbi:FRG domain-containing protein [Leptospira wolffii]|uniref:FRG domain-containing protein n=1 Tax=Leptospira wolffii TaxID=409998 RepID=UPI001084722E|nr:FRG domain-containing protein [Leptospira wolffii]TGL55274.1 FRG domain-containing protein [Leptospira wolffii]